MSDARRGSSAGQAKGALSASEVKSPRSKAEARRIAYEGLHRARAARFPFPIEGRIPNFKGAEAAARKLRQLPAYQQARMLKVNPDAPQLPIRAMALADGKTLYLPSPRLRGAFLRIRPEDVPAGEERKAASLSHAHRYGREICLRELQEDLQKSPGIGLIVCGCVAVSPKGARAGKGEGYSDLEYALLRELGHSHIPVVTTVHPAQIIAGLEPEAHDLSVDYIITPDEVIETGSPYPKPEGIVWELLPPERLKEMPVLAELRKLRWETAAVPDVIAPGLDLLFVGLNPGRASAGEGHHFAGPGNHFWRLLHEAGFTPVQYRPDEERALLGHGLGITNLIARPSRGEDDLEWSEFVEGGAALRERVRRFRPRIVALLGKNVYRAYAGLRRSDDVAWGLQPRETVEGVKEFAAPNPSPRSTLPYAERLRLFQALRALLQQECGE